MGWDVCSKGKTKYPNIKEFKKCSIELRVTFAKPPILEEQKSEPFYETGRTNKNSKDNIMDGSDEGSDIEFL